MWQAGRQSWKRRRRSSYGHALSSLLIVILLIAFVQSAHALFGLPTKRFRFEGLINAGSLGLEDVDGQVVAFGDWNADSAIDIFTLSADGRTIDVYLWDHATFAFVRSPLARITAPSGRVFVNVVPGDYNYDGKLDVLGMMRASEASATHDQIEMLIWLGTPDGSIALSTVAVDAATDVQPFIVDANGDMRADLIGHAASAKDRLSLWRNVEERKNSTNAFIVEDAPLFDSDSQSNATPPTCKLANPHSSAFIDLNGDCLADLFLVCEDSGWISSSLSYQIWTANKDRKKPGYTLARQGQLPKGAGAITFADMDRDGTIDVVLPSCDGGSGPCYINIAYNRQMPLCSEKRDDWFGVGPGGAALGNETLKCRDTESNLCTADDSFSFDFDPNPNNDKLVRIPVAEVTPEQQLLLTDQLLSPSLLVPLTLGDFNRDGYPDLAIITVPQNGRKDETRLRLLESVGCNEKGSTRAGCPADPTLWPSHRTFKMRTDSVLAIDAMNDVRSASFFDLDEDGSFDLIVQRLPADKGPTANQRRITFVQNNFFYDAFFLKAMTSNGACPSYCDSPKSGARYRPWGVNYNGASYKFTVLDTNGIRRPQQVGQLAQTSYRSLLLPYSYFGLGRTNNYVESLFVGVTRRRTKNFLEMEGVIPNSQVVILPWEPDANDQRGDTSSWQRELYLSPGEWIPWVTVVLVTIVIMLLGVVFVLHLHEKREDERERKRAVHAINFDAL